MKKDKIESEEVFVLDDGSNFTPMLSDHNWKLIYNRKLMRYVLPDDAPDELKKELEEHYIEAAKEAEEDE